MWSLLGQRPVDVCGWETFGLTWVKDITKQLKLNNVTTHQTSNYGEIPDLSKVNFDNDVVFTWNGTTSGACVPNADWIPDDRKGLSICDATSAVFAMEMDFKETRRRYMVLAKSHGRRRCARHDRTQPKSDRKARKL